MEKRERIVAAAIELCARDGFDGLTLRSVATHAGCWLGSVSHFFPEKDALLSEAVIHASQLCTQDILASLKRGRTPRARFRSFCQLVVNSYIRGVPHFVVIDRANSGSRPGEFPQIIQPSFDEAHAALARIIGELAPAHGTPPRWLIGYVLSLVYGAGKLHRQHRLLLKLESRASLDRFTNRLVDFALAGLRDAS